MSSLLDHPVARRWPPRRTEVIQLYSLPTPNGVKVSIMLEECGLEYDAHYVDFAQNDQLSPEFLALNPNNKIPAIIDPDGPGGLPLPLFESGAILIYLAEKTGRFLPGARRYEVLQWLMFQMGGLGPMLGQMGYFHVMAGKEIEDPRPRERFRAEAERLLKVLDGQLEGREWLAGDYSIADIAVAPWLRALREFYKMTGPTGFDASRNLGGYLEWLLARPAVQRGLVQPSRG